MHIFLYVPRDISTLVPMEKLPVGATKDIMD